MKKYSSFGSKNQIFHYFGFVFRPLQYEDMEEIRIWRNDQIDVLRQKNKITIDQQNNYFKEVINPTYNEKKPNVILFVLQKENAEEKVFIKGFFTMKFRANVAG